MPFRTVMIALLGAILLAACGSESSSGDVAPPASTTPGATPTATASAAPRATVTAAARRGVGLQLVGRFDQPVYVTSPPGDERRLFVVEQEGVIRVIRGGTTLRTPFLDLKSKVSCCGERGLLSMAFAPDYARSGRFYVSYTDTGGDTAIVEYRRRDADRADAGSARTVLTQEQPEVNHNGGLILFGPDDRLYVGLGDGGGGYDRHGSRGNAQSLETLLGKILRIDPRASGGRPYGVPSDNPFVGRDGARGEIYVYGLRNPWRFSFDRETGDLTIGDVGQNAVEEIDLARSGRIAGANFGWRPWEGLNRVYAGEDAPGHREPVITRTHDEGWCSITGGLVVRDRALAGLYGRYVFGDFCAARLLSARLRLPRARDVRSTNLQVPQLSSFGEDARGRVYAVSLSGPVYRLVPR